MEKMLDSSRHEGRARPRTTITVACGGVLVVIASMASLNGAVPKIGVETGATQNQLTWIIDGYTLALAALLLFGGAVGDRIGRRLVFHLGLAVFGVASLVPLVTSSPGALIVSRVACGIAAAFILPATLSMITASLDPEKRARGVAAWAIASTLSGGIGIIGCGFLLDHYSWESAFIGPAVVAAILVVVTPFANESRESASTPFDLVGSGLATVAVGLSVAGILEGPIRGWDDGRVLGLLVVGLLVTATFVIWELRHAYPILDVRLFLEPRFGAGAAGLLVQFLVLFAMLFLVAQQLQLILGWSALGAGLALGSIALTVVPMAIAAGAICRAIGMRSLVVTAMAFVGAGSVILTQVTPTSSITSYLAAILIMGVGLGLCTPVLTSAIVDSVSTDKQGVASAVNDASRELGAAIGIALGGSLLASHYTSQMTSAVAMLPAPQAQVASSSFIGASEIAHRMGESGGLLHEAARGAFTAGFVHAFAGLSIVLLVLTIALFAITPDRHGLTFFTVAQSWINRRRAGPSPIRPNDPPVV